jgi:hypothetical protein
MNRTSPGTNALRHGSCLALVCRCQRASAGVVGGPIPLHATYVTSTTPTVGDDDIPTHATGCRERLPLASTTHSHATVCRQRLPLASPTYYPPMLCTTPFLPPPQLAVPLWQCQAGHTTGQQTTPSTPSSVAPRVPSCDQFTTDLAPSCATPRLPSCNL